MSFFTDFAISEVLSFTTFPFFSLTIGPSILSQDVITAPFPGLSIFICVPVAIKSSRTIIVAGCIDFPAIPLALLLPYRNLNPPEVFENENIGLPPTISDINEAYSLLSSLSSFFFFPTDSKKSQLMSKSFAFFANFFAFNASPSPITKHAPPLILFVGILFKSLCAITSTSSVGSPSIHT